MDKSSPAVRERADAMDPELRSRVEGRAHALWESDGRPEGHALGYWLQAEQEIVYQSTAGEEDPLAGIDQETGQPPQSAAQPAGPQDHRRRALRARSRAGSKD